MKKSKTNKEKKKWQNLEPVLDKNEAIMGWKLEQIVRERLRFADTNQRKRVVSQKQMLDARAIHQEP